MTQFLHEREDSRYLSQPDGLRAYLFAGLGSTNETAKELARTVPLPFVVAADTQTAGRGTKGRSFHSPEGGLYCSYCFSVPVKALSSVTPRAAVAVARTLEDFGLSPAVKWVNDVLLDGRKVCGILTESVLRGDLAVVVCGIGINLYPEEAVPQELAGRIAHVWPYRDAARPQALFERLTVRMRQTVLAPAAFIDEYRHLSCVIGRRLEYFRDGAWHEATATGLEEDGRLIVRTIRGTERLSAEEIRMKNRGGENA